MVAAELSKTSLLGVRRSWKRGLGIHSLFLR